MPTSEDAGTPALSLLKRSKRWGDWPIVRSLIDSRPVLDLGCGDGELTRANDSVLVDVNRVPLRKAMQELKVVGDMHNLPFKESCFSCLVLNHVLEHSPDPQQVLAECRRVSARNARMVINVPNRRSIIDIVLSLVGKTNALTAVEHLQHFSRASIFRLMASNEFTQIRFHATFFSITHKVGFNTSIPVLCEMGRNIVVTAEVDKVVGL